MRGLILQATLLSLIFAPCGHAVAAAQGRASVKAVMIYNIVRFIELPEHRAQVRLCLRRSEDVANDLSALSGQPVGAGQLEVQTVATLADLGRACDVVYLGGGASMGVPLYGQVLIGEGSRFAEDGGTVGLVSFGDQLRFVINAKVAVHSGLKVSSQLMRLAARVIN